MRRVPLHEKEKVPVVKNIIFALKLVWKTDKKLLIGYLINMTVNGIYSFLKYFSALSTEGAALKSISEVFFYFWVFPFSLRRSTGFQTI